MKTISVFLASSIVEFKSDRLRIGDYIRRLNDELFPRGIYVNLVVCEEISNALHYARKQAQYNEMIKQCDLFYILVGNRAGVYTVEEYSTAEEAFRGNGFPEIRCFLRRGSTEPEDSVGQLADRIRGDGHPIMDFPDADSLIDDLERELRGAVSKAVAEGDTVPESSADHISILLAMPEHELKDEQVELSDFIRCLNDEYYPRGIFFDLVTFSELVSKAGRAGDQDFFYIVFRTEGDEAIVRSFDEAKEQFMRSGNPRIYTFFQTLPSGTAPSEGVRAFMDKLDKELGHFYSVFPNIDSLKLNMLIEVTRFRILTETVSVNDGSAYINGREFLELENVPAFSRNERLKAIRKELPGLLKFREELLERYSTGGEGEELRRSLSETSVKIDTLTKELKELENSILELFSAVAERNSSGRAITWREKEASRRLDEGDYEGALALLRDSSREEELKYAVSVMSGGRDAVMGYVSEEMLRIRALKAVGITQETLSEIYECYETCMRITKEQKLDPGYLYEYLGFLKDQRDYAALVRNGEWLTKYHELLGIEKDEAAQCYSDLGVGYRRTGRHIDAAAALERSVELWKELVVEDPERYGVNLARAYENLANVHYDMDETGKARDLMTKALGIFKRAAEWDASYKADAAKADGALANLYAKMNWYHDPEALYRSAIRDLEQLNADHPSEYRKELAECYHNLAVLYGKNNDHKKAEEICGKSLALRSELARENPAAFESDLASTLLVHGNICERTEKPRQAEEDYLRALHIYERHVSEQPSAYEYDLARICNNLGTLYAGTDRQSESEEYYKRSLEIFDGLAEKNPQVYESQSTKVSNNLARLYIRTGKYEDAEEMYRKVISVFEDLREKEPDVYSRDLANAFRNLSRLYIKTERYDEAEACINEALTILEQSSAKDPALYRGLLASSYRDYGLICFRQKRYCEWEDSFRRALEVYESMEEDEPGVYSEAVASACNNLASACLFREKYEESEHYYRRAIDICTKLSEGNHENYDLQLAESCNGLARLFRVTGRLEEAGELIAKAKELKKQAT
ncbi:MAG: tetratricopeptide repeat protein [Oscillospiraceae bacterium]|nr:tetratricopeptide repeat protein [Oscillospiraceae bacterium]